MKTFNGFFPALFVLVCLCSAGRATSVSLDALSNTSNTGYVSWINTQDKPETEDVYISQFKMNYTPAVGNASTLFTYCVDLNHTEQWGTAYNVTPVSLTSAFGQVNGNEIGYLYAKYGTSNLAGMTRTDEALQLALWDLSVTSHTPTTFSYDAINGVYSSGDSLFSVSGISSDVATQTNTYLKEAQGQSGGNVYVLQSGAASDPSLQQSVLAIDPNHQNDLAPAPEPTAFILCATLLGAWGLFGFWRSRLATFAAI